MMNINDYKANGKYTNYSDVYGIYIRSNEHPRTINTPRCGRTNYTKFEVQGKAAFIELLNALVQAGEVVTEVCHGWGCHDVNFYKYIQKGA